MQCTENSKYTNIQRKGIILTERVIDVSVWFVRGRSTVDLIVSQRHWNTHGVTESYVKVHQTTAALQMLSLHSDKIFVENGNKRILSVAEQIKNRFNRLHLTTIRFSQYQTDSSCSITLI